MPPISLRFLSGLGRAAAASCLLFAASQSAPIPAQAVPQNGTPFSSTQKYAVGGIYKDSAGGKHNWQITESHALLWDNAPYVPVGGAFAPRSFISEGEAAWQEDQKTLSTLKARGIHDLIIRPGVPLTEVPTGSFQKLIDFLEANDFHYGLEFGTGITTPLSGTVIKPTVYRFYEKDALTASWQVSNTDAGLFVLVDVDSQNALVKMDLVTVNGPVVSVPVETNAAAGRVVAQFYPHKRMPVTGDGSLPDLWAGFDDYRDKLISQLSHIKFGKGFRFFLDPLARHMGFAGETDYLVPDSDAFRLEWEGFLARTYATPEAAKNAWSLLEGDFKTFHDLVRMVPLWEKTHGVPYFYNAATGRAVRIQDAGKSTWWADFLRCRNESVQYYMNAMADLLKHQVADVPVVYTWTQTHPIFTNLNRSSGFDGLCIAPRGHGSTLLTRTLGPAYSQAEQTEKAVWCIADEISDMTTRGARTPAAAGTKTVQLTSPAQTELPVPAVYSTAAILNDDLDSLRRAGFKGFFAGGFQTSMEETGLPDWMSSPNSLDWLHDYAARMDREANVARYTPRILFYPQNAPGPAHTGMVPGSVATLWLNSFEPGETLDWWPAYSGYNLRRGNEVQTVLVSLQGPRLTHIWVQKPTEVRAYTPDGAPVALKLIGKTGFSVTLDKTPTIFLTGGQHLVLQEAADDAINQLETLYTLASARKLSSIEAVKHFLDNIHKLYKDRDFENAYNLALGKLNELVSVAQPYIWIEGEHYFSKVNTFDEVAPHPEASNGAYLKLSNQNDPTRYGYGVEYTFETPKDGPFNIWLAGSIPGPGVSAIQWRVDAPPDHGITNPNPQGPLYLGDRFGWTLLGTVNLTQGPHTLAIFVPARAVSPPIYNFSIDALMITQGTFVPNGTVRPLPVDLFTKNPKEKKK